MLSLWCYLCRSSAVGWLSFSNYRSIKVYFGSIGTGFIAFKGAFCGTLCLGLSGTTFFSVFQGENLPDLVKMRVLAKGVSVESSVTPQETKITQGHTFGT